MSHRSRNKKRTPVTRIDTLLLANYGIFQPTRRQDAMVVMGPLSELNHEDRRDLQEFAEFLMQVDRGAIEVPDDDGDEGLNDEP